MDDPRFVAALISAATAVVTALVTALIAIRLQQHQLKVEHAKVNIALEKLQREHSLSYEAEKVVHALLSDEQWPLRTFKTLQRHLGGFDEDELRRILVCSGAIRFITKESNTEVWGLLERNRDRLGAVEIDSEPQTRPFN